MKDDTTRIRDDTTRIRDALAILRAIAEQYPGHWTKAAAEGNTRLLIIHQAIAALDAAEQLGRD